MKFSKLKFNLQKKSLSCCAFFLFIFFSIFMLNSCGLKNVHHKAIAVFVPGIIDDSPIYANLVSGVKSAVEEFNQNVESQQVENLQNGNFQNENENSKNQIQHTKIQNQKNKNQKLSGDVSNQKVELFIFEAGTNQSEWLGQLTSLCASGKYDVIFSSNPSLPEIAKPLTALFPNQKFIFLDAFCAEEKNFITANYNQDEAAFITGYICALMSRSKKIGLIAAQEYPVMNEVILPSFEKGAKTANENVQVDFRIVGNWWDAKKGAELADSMSIAGVDAILPICGGAAQGVIASAKERGFYLSFFDAASYQVAPGLVISCVVNEQEKLAFELCKNYLSGNLDFENEEIRARSFGMSEGYITFVEDELYKNLVPVEIQQKVKSQIEKIKNGK